MSKKTDKTSASGTVNTDKTSTTDSDVNIHQESNKVNAAQTDAAVKSIDNNDLAEKYMQKFAEVETKLKHMDDIVNKFAKQEHDQARLYVVMDYLKELHPLHGSLYDLMVEMNNFFAPK